MGLYVVDKTNGSLQQIAGFVTGVQADYDIEGDANRTYTKELSNLYLGADFSCKVEMRVSGPMLTVYGTITPNSEGSAWPLIETADWYVETGTNYYKIPNCFLDPDGNHNNVSKWSYDLDVYSVYGSVTQADKIKSHFPDGFWESVLKPVNSPNNGAIPIYVNNYNSNDSEAILTNSEQMIKQVGNVSWATVEGVSGEYLVFQIPHETWDDESQVFTGTGRKKSGVFTFYFTVPVIRKSTIPAVVPKVDMLSNLKYFDVEGTTDDDGIFTAAKEYAEENSIEVANFTSVRVIEGLNTATPNLRADGEIEIRYSADWATIPNEDFTIRVFYYDAS